MSCVFFHIISTLANRTTEHPRRLLFRVCPSVQIERNERFGILIEDSVVGVQFERRPSGSFIESLSSSGCDRLPYVSQWPSFAVSKGERGRAFTKWRRNKIEEKEFKNLRMGYKENKLSLTSRGDF